MVLAVEIKSFVEVKEEELERYRRGDLRYEFVEDGERMNVILNFDLEEPVKVLANKIIARKMVVDWIVADSIHCKYLVANSFIKSDLVIAAEIKTDLLYANILICNQEEINDLYVELKCNKSELGIKYRYIF